ncbi:MULTISPECIES: xanthine dehydrogenase family protein molybdopterin-binding subunit [unclassified Novosphingobium]|uniref:xanthine dehydrogenase family protein molybdopterin-binding subunit n=1 Tax=unclassified Novosphingobium TaxID=2644732 RepID=UPI000D3008B9|nr:MULTISPECIES: xanthine dehydrogenase family protein molybdopterin-binding subunit [unclassified Novosphingobium]PTR10938.1 xanthine dehydrogenase YagR molybdenum-binding subunit [Novosphingobium sp. GV055]PUB03488.1 xanthine dehydrogenase YagR molybdenum-binding subunit [Novosphingobium sp. GV061]PUB19943.1 xanthine dehydrogenase YagR molybdenum-binding subunit [Novosphingobium sp. GV079]PUB41704.1 xanthine dehydrogenase YagR molybdenum-binding subunit [Novosphingobium sp. GV027]
MHLPLSDMYNQPDERNLLDQMRQGVIGQPLDRPEGPLKVSGTATYAAEWRIDGCVEGELVLASIAQGQVSKIDSDAVLSREGVIAVIADPAMTRRPAQGMAAKAPQQDAAKVEYFGQPVALVVAQTFEQARDAALALPIDYTDADGDPVPFDPAAPGVKVEAPSSSKPVEGGDLDQAMRDAAFSVDVEYDTPGHASAAMEPHATIAQWQGDSLILHGSYQMLSYNVKEIADCLGLSADKVRIIAPYVGGGFGSKLGITHEAVAAAIAARELGRPVRVVMSRQQVFQTVMRRSETRQRVRLAADPAGRLIGLGHEALVSNLPGEKFAEPVTQATEFLYGGENRLLKVEVARISRMTAGSVRAPGEAVGMQVLEAAMDELAEKIGIDPIELRKRNLPAEVPVAGTPYSSRMLTQALEQGAEAFGWSARQDRPCQTRDGDWWIGMGVASAARVNMMVPAKAQVTLKADGSAVVESDQTDIGTGSYAILGQIAGEMLGLPMARVDVKLGDTVHPAGAGSGGSFGAISTGSAVMYACEAIRAKLAKALGCDADALVLKDGMASGGNAPARPLRDLLNGEDIAETGTIKPGKTAKSFSQASYGAFFAEVAVHAFTGEVRVRRMTGAFGFGRVLNAKTARSQCLGGMVWGIGSALTEELAFDTRDGHLVNHDLAEYHVPVHADVPAIEVILLEERDAAASPLQAKGVGELGICGAAGAIANAVYNACGVRVRSFPLTLDKILPALPDPFASGADTAL